MDADDCKLRLKELHKKSEIIVLQEFFHPNMIGVLVFDQKPIFVWKYYMAKDHWQIYQWNNAGSGEVEGDSENIPITQRI